MTTTTVTQAQLDRLPQWAQGEIQLLKMRLTEAQASIAQLEAASSEEPSNITCHYLNEPRKPLRKGTHIRFTLRRGVIIEMYIDYHGNLLAFATSGDRLLVMPEAANSIILTTHEAQP